MPSFPQSAPLEIYLLGCVDFEVAARLQRRLVYESAESGGGSLVLCEHPPTISVGRSGSRAHIRPDDLELKDLGVRAHWVNRGGGCVLHVPGQLCAYLALPLRPLGLDLRSYLSAVGSILQNVLAEFDLKGQCPPDASGMYLGHARVASIGIAVNRWIAYHGFTLNVGPYLGAFEILDEPGHGGLPLHQTSLEARRQRPAPMSRVREAVIRQIESVFGLERHHVYTEHPQVRRETRPHVYADSLG